MIIQIITIFGVLIEYHNAITEHCSVINKQYTVKVAVLNDNKLYMTDIQTIKERLILSVKSKKIGQGKFETQCGLSNGYVNNIRKSIQPDKLQKISLCFPELNAGWLMTGEGAMLKTGAQEQLSSSSEVSILLHKLELMHLLPNYIDITSDPAKFKKLFFDAAIKFVTELKFTEEQARYIASNFDSGLKYIKPEELIEKLREIQQNGDTDSTYYIMLGFRSLWFLLNNNKDNVSLIFVDEVTEILHPFFLSTQCPIEYSIRY